jgi:hypothetical protein
MPLGRQCQSDQLEVSEYNMIKRVMLDKDGWPTELDWKAIRRVALELRAYSEAAPLGEVLQYEYKTRVMPLIEATLDRSIEIPFPLNKYPYDIRYIMEGLYPELVPKFRSIYSEFMCRIRPDIGIMSLSYHESGNTIYDYKKYRETDENGNVYEMCWFED